MAREETKTVGYAILSRIERDGLVLVDMEKDYTLIQHLKVSMNRTMAAGHEVFVVRILAREGNLISVGEDTLPPGILYFELLKPLQGVEWFKKKRAELLA